MISINGIKGTIGAVVSALLFSAAAGCGDNGLHDMDEPNGIIAPSAEGSTTPQVVAQPQLDAEGRPPPDYVPTPLGYYHRSCVYELPNGATIDEQSNVVSEKGVVVRQLKKCPYASIRRARVDPSGDLAAAAETNASPPTLGGWVEWAEQGLSSGQFNKMEGDMPVPTAPPSFSGQLIYLFPGFQPASNSSIIQTVLQFGTSPAGGGAFWGLAAWQVNSDNTAVHSPLVRVSEGDIIHHKMYVYDRTCSGAPLYFCRNWWKLEATDTTVPSKFVSLSVSQSFSMTHAFPVALEAYNVTACNQLPASGYAEFYGASLYQAGSGGVLTYAPVAYSPTTNLPPSSPSCGYAGISGSAGSFLFWTP